MNVVHLAVGSLVLIVVIVDSVRTVISVGAGDGGLTSRLAYLEWRLVRGASRVGGQQHRALSIAGPAIVTSVVVMWLVLLWAGWWLIFWGSGTVERSTTGEPANFWETGYFAGFMLSTIGLGDYRATSEGWQLLSVVTGITGFAILTAAVTYLLAVVNVVSNRRALASTIHALGSSPVGIVLGRSGSADMNALSDELSSLYRELSTIVQQNLTYPVAQYFHSHDASAALAPRLAALDEALAIASTCGLTQKPEHLRQFETMRQGISLIVDTVPTEEGALSPPAPNFAPLCEAGVEIDEEGVRRAMASDAAHRARLHGMVQSEGWEWRESVLLEER